MRKNLPLHYQLFAEILIVAIIMSSAIFVFLPRPAKAATLAFEVNPIMTIMGWLQTFKEWVGDGLIYFITTRILANIANQTTNWIRTGTTPSFVRDWRAFLLDSGVRSFSTANAYISAKVIPRTVPKYQPLLRRLLTNVSTNPLNANVESLINSTLGSRGITTTVLNTFAEDFNAGGGWQTLSALAEPNNDFYYNYLQILNAQGRAVATAKEAEKNEALAGAGFIGKKSSLTGITQTPGSTLGTAVQSALIKAPLGKLENSDELIEAMVTLLTTSFSKLISEGLAPLSGSSIITYPAPTTAAPPTANVPGISISVSPTSIPRGDSATVRWSVTNNPNLCVSSGAWGDAQKSSSGTQSVSPSSNGTYTYTLQCFNASGSANRSATLRVTEPTISDSSDCPYDFGTYYYYSYCI